jgi:peptidoglycan hydrolase-like protein with peptidoglycan-binding domain
VDGVFGPATDAAVRRAQTDIRNFFNLGNRFAVDGIVGPQTWFWLK